MTEIIKIKLSVSNAYLVKDKKAILIDTGSPNEADKILAAVNRAEVHVKDPSDPAYAWACRPRGFHSGIKAQAWDSIRRPFG